MTTVSNRQSAVAIIPARGGSKRILCKNIKLFAGKPIIAYSIEAAQKTGIFEKIIVTTDSDEIADMARQYGAETPFKRPPEIADDFTPTAPVVAHAMNWLAENGVQSHYACCIYATAPFVRPEHIKQGYELMLDKNVSSVFSVTTFPFPIFRALQQKEDGSLAMFWPEHEMSRSNDLPEAYHDAGHFYWLESGTFLKEQKMYGKDALPVILPRYLVQDIDTPEDWQTAEYMYKALKMKQTGEEI